jgi:hypothetical protein
MFRKNLFHESSMLKIQVTCQTTRRHIPEDNNILDTPYFIFYITQNQTIMTICTSFRIITSKQKYYGIISGHK